MAEETNKALETLQTELLKPGGIVSSEDTEFETAVAGIKTGLEEGQEKRAAGIEAGFERQKIGVAEAGARKKTSALEARRGFATNTALLRQLDEETEKSIRDLDLRKTEALAAGEVETANQLAQIQLQEIQFRSKQRQQGFQNLMSLAGLEFQQEQIGFEAKRLGFEENRIDIAREGLTLQERQVGIAEAAQKQAERTAISEVALQYGLEITEGETLETIVQKAQPFASDQQKVALEKQRAEIANIKANTQKAIQDGTGLSDANLDIIAEAAIINSAVLGTLKNPQDVAKVINKMTALNKPRDFGENELLEIAQLNLNSDIPFNQALAELASDSQITNKDEAERILREVYNKPVQDSIFEKAEQRAKGRIEEKIKSGSKFILPSGKQITVSPQDLEQLEKSGIKIQ